MGDRDSIGNMAVIVEYWVQDSRGIWLMGCQTKSSRFLRMNLVRLPVCKITERRQRVEIAARILSRKPWVITTNRARRENSYCWTDERYGTICHVAN